MARVSGLTLAVVLDWSLSECFLCVCVFVPPSSRCGRVSGGGGNALVPVVDYAEPSAAACSKTPAKGRLPSADRKQHSIAVLTVVCCAFMFFFFFFGLVVMRSWACVVTAAPCWPSLAENDLRC